MDPRQWLTHLEQFGIKLGLSTIAAIAQELGDPHRRFRVIHVAGTNGKGSVCAMVARALSSAGHRTGLYTSPHLVHLEERFRIDGRSIAADRLDRALVEVRTAVERLQARGVLEAEPTYFEATTAAAFLVFALEGVQVAVIEVGLGGRYDATNVVSPLATGITALDFDHEAQLGTSLTAIAGEKAGIVKPAVPVVAATMDPEARAVLESVCRERSAPLFPPAAVTAGSGEDGHERLTFAWRGSPVGPVRLSLAGAHQAGNAAVALRILEVVDDLGLAVGAEHVAIALTTTRWPARLEDVVTPRGRVLVDGAHNPAGARALAWHLQRRHPAGLPIVFGAMRDKPLAAMLAPLAPLARPFVFTHAPGARAAGADELAKAAGAGTDWTIEADLDRALAVAWRHAPEIALAGSLHLAGAALACLGVPVD